MKLQTQLELQPGKPPLHYRRPVVLLGSCFATHIGDKLDYYKFPVTLNPFGILFHPKGIKTLVERSVAERFYSPDEVFFQNERWHCFDAHSELSNPSKAELIRMLNEKLSLTKEAMGKASHIIITLGTAWAYKRKKTGAWVANCHKVPQQEFDKELCTVAELVEALKVVVRIIRQHNPTVTMLFSVSPVRHLKDGFVENQRSKAHLITALHQCLQQHKGSSLHYFPAYELMMDELRDYRFYGSDLLHPNELAVEYIWEKFTQTWIDEDAYPDMSEVGVIRKGLAHRPLFPESEEYRKFMQSLQLRIKTLQQKYPYMSF